MFCGVQCLWFVCTVLLFISISAHTHTHTHAARYNYSTLSSRVYDTDITRCEGNSALVREYIITYTTRAEAQHPVLCTLFTALICLRHVPLHLGYIQ